MHWLSILITIGTRLRCKWDEFFDPVYRSRAKYIRHLRRPVDKKLHLYESFQGETAGGSPFALFCAMLDHPDYRGVTHVWLINGDPDETPLRFCDREDVVVTRRNTPLYFRTLATAGLLINNVTFHDYFVKRPEQIYINTWHGTPLKTLGKDITTAPYGLNANVTRNFLLADIIIHPNAYTTEKINHAYDIEGLFPGKIAEFGCPEVDLVLNSDRAALRQTLGIADDETLILYMPTWRGAQNAFQNNTGELVGYVQTMAAHMQSGQKLLLKPHSLQREALLSGAPDVPLAPNELETGALLAAADVLITDYSSVFFDFLCTGRPILFFTYDREHYFAERGVYFPLEDVPGPLCDTVDELIVALNHLDTVQTQYAAQYAHFKKKFAPYDDGKSCERVMALLRGDRAGVLDSTPCNHPSHASQRTVDPLRLAVGVGEAAPLGETAESLRSARRLRRILIYPGNMATNGITSAALNLLHNIDHERYEVFCLLHLTNFQDPIAKIDPRCTLLYTTRPSPFAFGERGLYEDFCVQPAHTPFAKNLCKKPFFKREVQRIFGNVTFDVLIDFNGYSRYVAGLLTEMSAQKKIVYFHNNMEEERRRFPYIGLMYHLYKKFDHIAGVSEASVKENFSAMTKHYSQIAEKLTCVENTLDIDGIRNKAQSETLTVIDGKTVWSEANTVVTPAKVSVLPAVPVYEPGDFVFVAIGRCLRQKNFRVLLEGFQKANLPNTKLYLIGAGPELPELKKYAEQSGLVGKVVFTGWVQNPYYFLARADAFVLPSLYEAQPVVLLESFLLGKPVLISNIPTSRALVDAYGGTVCPQNTPEGWAKALADFRQCGGKAPQFDPEVKNAHSLGQLYALIED